MAKSRAPASKNDIVLVALFGANGVLMSVEAFWSLQAQPTLMVVADVFISAVNLFLARRMFLRFKVAKEEARALAGAPLANPAR